MVNQLSVQVSCVVLGLIISSASITDAQIVDADQGSTGSQPPDVVELIGKLKDSVYRWRTVQYHATATRELHATTFANPKNLPQLKPHKVTYGLIFAGSDQRFFSRTRMSGLPDAKSTDDELAFDGKKYQRFSENTGLLELTKFPREIPTQSYFIQPLIVPLVFTFTDDETLDFRQLIDEHHWDWVAAATMYIGTAHYDKHDCEVVEVRRVVHGTELRYRTYLGVEYGYLPLLVTLETELGTVTCTAEYDRVKTDDGIAIVPINVATHETAPDGTPVATMQYTVDPSTLKINQLIPDSRFTIDRSRAHRGIFDEDTRTRTLSDPRTSPRRSTLLIVNLGVVAIVLVAAIVYWWRSGRSPVTFGQ